MDKIRVNKDLENKTLTIEREFNAPADKIWRACADKEQFEKWWGPEGWETTTTEFDLTPGGKIHYGMKCVDKNQGEWFGKESWGIMEIESVDEQNRFTAKDYFSDAEGNVNQEMPMQKFIVEFLEEGLPNSKAGGKTRLITRCVTESAEQLEQLLKMGMAEGFSSQLEKLERLVGSGVKNIDY